MKRIMQWMKAAILVCGATVFTACSSDDDNAGTKDDGNAKKALLIILDGWGNGNKNQGDVIAQTSTPYMDYLKANYPNSELQASGEYVGLPDGQMGNSETGHLNIGAGRIVYQDLVKINRACADNSILDNPEIKAAYSYAKENGKNLHLMGLMISVSSSFATPIGSPTHMLVYAPGGYRFSDFMRIGLLMNLIILAANIFIVNIVYPLTPLQ